MDSTSETARLCGAFLLEDVLTTLGTSVNVQAALLRQFGPDRGAAAIDMLTVGKLTDLLGDEVHDFLSDEIANNSVAVWCGYTFDPNEPLDSERHFPVKIMEYEHVYYVFASEFDNVGYFKSLLEAKSYIDSERENLIEKPCDENSNPDDAYFSFGEKMKIETCTYCPDNLLEKYRPADTSHQWELVASGFWSEDMNHSGHIAYYITKAKNGTWVMDGVVRNTILDGVTDEDVEEGLLNDDQIQAMWRMTLEEAQSKEYRRIVAVCRDAPLDAKAKDVAELMYDAIEKADGKIIDEPDADGILDV